jgi:hypothetical protein
MTRGVDKLRTVCRRLRRNAARERFCKSSDSRRFRRWGLQRPHARSCCPEAQGPAHPLPGNIDRRCFGIPAAAWAVTQLIFGASSCLVRSSREVREASRVDPAWPPVHDTVSGTTGCSLHAFESRRSLARGQRRDQLMRPDFYSLERDRFGRSAVACGFPGAVREICALSRGSWFRRAAYVRTVKTASGATAVQIVLSSRHVPRVAMSPAASGGRTSEPVAKEAP